MLSRELQVVERARVHRRQNKAPCPGGNGTTIGTFQEFTVLCNTNLEGDVLDRPDASDFKACVDLCSSFHPKCEGATFDGLRCTLKANLRPEEQRPSRRSESAIGEFPGATSNCPTLGGAQQALGTSFTTMCGFIIDGGDLSQNFAPTFQDCLGQCALTSGCAALSFDPSQDLGFKNCYLKTAVTNSSAIAADQRTDSAMVVAAASVSSGSSSQVPSPSASPLVPPAPIPPTTDPGVSILPSPSPSPATTPGAGSGAVFFTPPAVNTRTEPAPPATSTSTSTSVPVPDSSTLTITGLLATPSSSLATGSFPFFFPGPNTTPVSSAESVPDTTVQEPGASPPSMAWVAAPVVGSVAAIALIAVSFVMIRRRRRGSVGEKPSISTLFTAWLPASWSSSSRDERGGSNKKKTGMGNFSEVESGRRSVDMRSSMRSSVVGFMTGRPMGMERLEDIEEGESTGDATVQRKGSARASEVNGGRPELRSSLNGLRQNRWS
ncbi:hypothetical protein C8A03DRAFT_44796 [Achaetomium macrosporum]|uniref:Apple domain-containing protein n=1 Tax=Achaetomium macrosporum TaxID=79813 RepID=A0AAN7C9M4_9PEZI|nr:hypothetical protein C8A03DRAFT_44796 [Achaetomium macrosporum]